ncbi:hypothetical protein CVT26_001865 [Gymnopilus dilepis]|uniref:Ubiquitin 3 binding protein But2 C-terminal domain-containing protein n=1 Tax=Gymnopilus dilepis TaxID=231916 RepID=A0A409Y3W7_9AGAR|nr:hypothetical protein CVT26_001865 [Gymnopilus dilepis]
MQPFASISLLLFATLSSLVSAATIPNADTPLFYLVASSPASVNLLPLRRTSSGGGYASLLGSGAPAQLYFYQGQLVLNDPSGFYRSFIDTHQDANGCQKFGALGFLQSNTNKCASFGGFQLQSNNLDSQLGAQLVVNYVGGFYSCNGGSQVSYKIDPESGPSNCQPINLYTVPVY